MHIRDAYVALRNNGYEISRIPLTVYLETPKKQRGLGAILLFRSLRSINNRDVLGILKKVNRAKFVPIKLPNCGE